MIVGAILIRSAVGHLENSYAFLASIYAYDLVSSGTGLILAASLPATQLTLGLMLLSFRNMRYFALTVSAVLFLLFSVVQGITLVRGLNIGCGCFGSSMPNPIGWQSLSFVVGLCFVSALAAIGLRPKVVVTG